MRLPEREGRIEQVARGFQKSLGACCKQGRSVRKTTCGRRLKWATEPVPASLPRRSRATLMVVIRPGHAPCDASPFAWRYYIWLRDPLVKHRSASRQEARSKDHRPTERRPSVFATSACNRLDLACQFRVSPRSALRGELRDRCSQGGSWSRSRTHCAAVQVR